MFVASLGITPSEAVPGVSRGVGLYCDSIGCTRRGKRYGRTYSLPIGRGKFVEVRIETGVLRFGNVTWFVELVIDVYFAGNLGSWHAFSLF